MRATTVHISVQETANTSDPAMMGVSMCLWSHTVLVFKAGGVIGHMVSLLDIPPTLLGWGGINKPDDMQGRPFQQLMDGNVKDWPDSVFLQISESQVGRAIRTKKWKYSVRDYSKDGWKNPESDCYEEDFLYDLENDPHEKNNLVLDVGYTSVRQELAKMLKSSMRQAGENVPEIKPAVHRKLRL